jgi:hypothetical protein
MARERAIRNMFTELGSKPAKDFVATNGPVPTPTRYLLYELKGSADEIATVTRNVLRDVYAIGADEPLEISFTENGNGN